jgi:hypothetical protein
LILEGCFLSKSLVATKRVTTNKGKITNIGNSGTEGAELGIETVGSVAVSVGLVGLGARVSAKGFIRG